MCTNGTPVPPYLAKWSCTVQAAPAPDVAVAHTAAWARATMDNWGLGGLAWTHGSPPVEVTLLLQDSVLTVEVSDAGAGLAVFAGPRPLGAGGRGLPAAVDVAQQIGIDGGAWGTRVWARLPFQWIPAQTEPGAAAA